jgi:hypothetical protein
MIYVRFSSHGRGCWYMHGPRRIGWSVRVDLYWISYIYTLKLYLNSTRGKAFASVLEKVKKVGLNTTGGLLVENLSAHVSSLERIFGTPRPRIRKFKSRRGGKEMDLTRAGPTKLLRDSIVPHLSTSKLAPPCLQILAASCRSPVSASPTPTLAKLLPSTVDASLF